MIKAIVGANWGDEGKGKITDVLAENTEALRDLKEVVALLKDKVTNEK